jgi:hypothetical protein
MGIQSWNSPVARRLGAPWSNRTEADIDLECGNGDETGELSPSDLPVLLVLSHFA